MKRKSNIIQSDEQRFENSMATNSPLDKQIFKRLLVSDICSQPLVKNEVRIGTYTFDEIKHILSNPRTHRNQLLTINEEMKRLSPHYRRVIEFYGNIPVLDWYIDLHGILPENFNTEEKQKRLKARYSRVEIELEKMNIKHEFNKVFSIIASQDVFYGLVNETATEFFFQKLNPMICEIYEIQDGVYNFKINLNQIAEIEIEKYPSYIQLAWQEWRNGTGYWQYAPDVDKQICIKFDESSVVTMPPLLNAVKDLFDLDTFKKLKVQSGYTDNYKAIATEVPFANDKTDKPLVSIDTIEMFGELNHEALNDNIGLLHTVGKTHMISFKDNSNTRNNVKESTDDFFNSVGIDETIFNGGNSVGVLQYSLENNSSYIYAIYRQIERWINRYLKFKGLSDKTIKFSVSILDSTVFNREDVTKRYAQAIQYGTPVKREYIASLGVTPSKANCSAFFENTLLGWDKSWIPVQSAYTQSSVHTENTLLAENAIQDSGGDKLDE